MLPDEITLLLPVVLLALVTESWEKVPVPAPVPEIEPEPEEYVSLGVPLPDGL